MAGTARTITNRELTPGAVYFVRGKVGFSHITKLTTDEERFNANQRRQIAIDRNYTILTIYEATILAQNGNVLSKEEQYAVEHMYHSSSAEYPGNNYQGMNKSSRLPNVAVLQPGSNNQYGEIVPEAELAKGLDVTLVMRVFKGQAGNNGVSLDTVLVNEPIRYYGSSVEEVNKAMSAIGLIFTPMDATEKAAQLARMNPVSTDSIAPEEPANSYAPAAPITPASAQGGYGQPAVTQPIAQPVAPQSVNVNTSNPFSSYEAAPAAAPAVTPAQVNPAVTPANPGAVAPNTYGAGVRQY